jgi:hypothetical protein
MTPPSSPRAGEAPEDDGCAFMGTFMGVDQRCDEPPFSHWHDPSHAAFKHAYEHDCGDCPPVRAGEAEGGVRPDVNRLADALSREWPFAYSPPEAWVPVVERALARMAALASPEPDEEARP